MIVNKCAFTIHFYLFTVKKNKRKKTFFLLFAISEYSPHDHSGPKGTMSSKLQIICFRKQKKTEKIRRNNISETETIRPLLVLLKDERKKEKKRKNE